MESADRLPDAVNVVGQSIWKPSIAEMNNLPAAIRQKGQHAALLFPPAVTERQLRGRRLACPRWHTMDAPIRIAPIESFLAS